MLTFVISQLTAGYRQNGWLAGWLVGGKTCLSVACQSVRATFGHISGTGRPINFVFGVRKHAQERRDSAESIIRAAGVRKHARRGEARQGRVYNAIRVDSVPSCKLGSARTRPRVLFCFFTLGRCSRGKKN